MFITIKSNDSDIEYLGEYQKLVEKITGLKALFILKKIEVNIVNPENGNSIKL